MVSFATVSAVTAPTAPPKHESLIAPVAQPTTAWDMALSILFNPASPIFCDKFAPTALAAKIHELLPWNIKLDKQFVD